MPHLSVRQLLALRHQANALDRPIGTDVAEVLRRIVGAQAQTWRGAAYAVRSRSTGTTFADVSSAREVDRTVVRGWFMRGTLQLVARDDAGLLLGILGPKLIRDTQRRYGELGLPEQVQREAAVALERHLMDNGPATRAELGEVLVEAGLVGETTGQPVYALIRHAGLLGKLCYGPGHDRTETWVAVQDWLGEAFDLRGDVTELAGRYLQAYGPANEYDFATWSGLPVPVARAGLKGAARGEVEVEGQRLAVLGPPDPGSETEVRLAGEFDPYLLGYRDRRWALPEADRRRIHPGGGMIRPAIIRSGLVVGTWSHATRQAEFFGDDVDLSRELEDVNRFERSLDPAMHVVEE